MPVPGEMDAGQARRADAQSEEHNINGETSYTQRSSAQLWVVLASVRSRGPAASLTSLGLCLASPSTLCAVSRPVLFLSHLDVLPSFPHRTHTLPPAQCVWHGHSGNSGRRKEKEERRRAWIATTPQRKRDERPSHRGRESPLPYYWPTVPKRFQVQISFCLVFS